MDGRVDVATALRGVECRGREGEKGSARGMFVDYVITGQVGMTGSER